MSGNTDYAEAWSHLFTCSSIVIKICTQHFLALICSYYTENTTNVSSYLFSFSIAVTLKEMLHCAFTLVIMCYSVIPLLLLLNRVEL